jgi:hypothetical protein
MPGRSWYTGALVLICLAPNWGCRATEPDVAPRVTLSARALGTPGGDASDAPLPVTVDGRVRSLVVSGGPGLTCGLSAASGHAERRGVALTVRLDFRPLASCPYVGRQTAYDAVVSGLPGEAYDVTVVQAYWADRSPETVFRGTAYVAQ